MEKLDELVEDMNQYTIIKENLKGWVAKFNIEYNEDIYYKIISTFEEEEANCEYLVKKMKEKKVFYELISTRIIGERELKEKMEKAYIDINHILMINKDKKNYILMELWYNEHRNNKYVSYEEMKIKIYNKDPIRKIKATTSME